MIICLGKGSCLGMIGKAKNVWIWQTIFKSEIVTNSTETVGGCAIWILGSLLHTFITLVGGDGNFPPMPHFFYKDKASWTYTDKKNQNSRERTKWHLWHLCTEFEQTGANV